MGSLFSYAKALQARGFTLVLPTGMELPPTARVLVYALIYGTLNQVEFYLKPPAGVVSWRFSFPTKEPVSPAGTILKASRFEEVTPQEIGKNVPLGGVFKVHYLVVQSSHAEEAASSLREKMSPLFFQKVNLIPLLTRTEKDKGPFAVSFVASPSRAKEETPKKEEFNLFGAAIKENFAEVLRILYGIDLGEPYEEGNGLHKYFSSCPLCGGNMSFVVIENPDGTWGFTCGSCGRRGTILNFIEDYEFADYEGEDRRQRLADKLNLYFKKKLDCKTGKKEAPPEEEPKKEEKFQKAEPGIEGQKEEEKPRPKPSKKDPQSSALLVEFAKWFSPQEILKEKAPLYWVRSAWKNIGKNLGTDFRKTPYITFNTLLENASDSIRIPGEKKGDGFLLHRFVYDWSGGIKVKSAGSFIYDKDFIVKEIKGPAPIGLLIISPYFVNSASTFYVYSSLSEALKNYSTYSKALESESRNAVVIVLHVGETFLRPQDQHLASAVSFEPLYAFIATEIFSSWNRRRKPVEFRLYIPRQLDRKAQVTQNIEKLFSLREGVRGKVKLYSSG